jgi:hypothetical protein
MLSYNINCKKKWWNYVCSTGFSNWGSLTIKNNKIQYIKNSRTCKNTVNSLYPDAETLEILAVDKNGPNTSSFTIKNIQYTYWFCNCILCQVDFIDTVGYYKVVAVTITAPTYNKYLLKSKVSCTVVFIAAGKPCLIVRLSICQKAIMKQSRHTVCPGTTIQRPA